MLCGGNVGSVYAFSLYLQIVLFTYNMQEGQAGCFARLKTNEMEIPILGKLTADRPGKSDIKTAPGKWNGML